MDDAHRISGDLKSVLTLRLAPDLKQKELVVAIIRAVRKLEPLESRLEALEAEVQAKESALKSIIDTFHSDSRPMGHVAKAMLAIAAEALTAQPPARLRELVPPREGAPTEEDSRG